MELDDLKRAWQECDRNLHTGIHLNIGRLRSRLLEFDETPPTQILPSGIDYSGPIPVVQKQIERTQRRKWFFVQIFEEFVESVLFRAFRRKRVLRG
jgi:hypothetical protein